MMDADALRVPGVYLGDWEKLPELHQARWENRLLEATGGAAKAVIDHALSETGIRNRDDLCTS